MADDADKMVPLLLLTLQLHTEDPEERRIAVDYWSHALMPGLPLLPTWTMGAATLARRVSGARTQTLHQHVSRLGTATFTKADCDKCGGNVVVGSRSQLLAALSAICESCYMTLLSTLREEGRQPDAPAAPEPASLTPHPAVARHFPVIGADVRFEDVERLSIDSLVTLSAIALHAPALDPIPALVDSAWRYPLLPDSITIKPRLLAESGLLGVHPMSRWDAFTWTAGEDERPEEFDPSQVCWYFVGHGGLPERARYFWDLVAELLAEPLSLQSGDEISELLIDIMAAEMRRYFNYRLTKDGLPELDATGREQLFDLSDTMARRYSIGQMIGLISGPAKDLPSMAEFPSGNQQFLRRVRAYVDKDAEENWDISHRKIPHDLPLSAVTCTLFEAIRATSAPHSIGPEEIKRCIYAMLEPEAQGAVTLREGPSDIQAETLHRFLAKEYLPMLGSSLAGEEFANNSGLLEVVLEVLGNVLDIYENLVGEGIPEGRALQASYYGLDHLEAVIPDSYTPVAWAASGHRILAAVAEAKSIVRRSLVGYRQPDSAEKASLRTLTDE